MVPFGLSAAAVTVIRLNPSSIAFVAILWIDLSSVRRLLDSFRAFMLRAS
jgi:hypothetical protein